MALEVDWEVEVRVDWGFWGVEGGAEFEAERPRAVVLGAVGVLAELEDEGRAGWGGRGLDAPLGGAGLSG